MTTRPERMPLLRREITATFSRATEDSADANPTFDISFSSELAVERWFGFEVLSHAKGAGDFSRLNDGGVLLFNHNRDKPIGFIVSGSARLDGKTGRAGIRFYDDAEGALWRGRVERGEISTVSFAYRIYDMVESKKDGESTYTATRWEALEISLVTIPADPTVGFGRAGGDDGNAVSIRTAEDAEQPSNHRSQTMEPTTQPAAPTQPVNIEVVRAEALQQERQRVANIQALGEAHSCQDLARKLINDGASVEDARVAVLNHLTAAGRQQPAASPINVDMTGREARSYSLCRAILNHLGGRRDEGLEGEVSREIRRQADKLGLTVGEGILIPTNLPIPYVSAETARSIMGPNSAALVADLTRARAALIGERAPYAVGAGATGGNLVATDLLAGSFIDILRNRAMVNRLGATMLTGLTGKVDIPRQITASQTYWVAESGAPTEAEATFDKVSLSPKTMGALSVASRLMLLQATPDIEALVRADLAAVMALGIDLAALHGTGSGNQPTGLSNLAGIGSVVGGTNGLIPTWGNIVDLETAVAVPNADVGNLAYLSNAKVRGKLKQVVKAANTAAFIWNSTPGDPLFGEVNGYRAATSNQVTSTGTKGTSTGVCSTIFFGNWAELLIGSWGVLEILANPYSTGFAAGDIQIRSLQTVDVQARHAASFAAMSDALTT